jgi:transposase
MERKAYKTDLSDEQWKIIESLLTAEKKTGTTGKNHKHSYREILNAILYLLRTGCQWEMLPHDFPPYPTVNWYFRAWTVNNTLERIHDALRHQVREQAGKEPTPSALIIDSQSVKTTEAVRPPEKGGSVAMTVAKRSKEESVISL